MLDLLLGTPTQKSLGRGVLIRNFEKTPKRWGSKILLCGWGLKFLLPLRSINSVTTHYLPVILPKNIMSPARAKIQTAQLSVEHTSNETTNPPLVIVKQLLLFGGYRYHFCCLLHCPLKGYQTADRLAQLVERRTTEREVSDSSPRPYQHSGS